MLDVSLFVRIIKHAVYIFNIKLILSWTYIEVIGKQKPTL